MLFLVNVSKVSRNPFFYHESKPYSHCCVCDEEYFGEKKKKSFFKDHDADGLPEHFEYATSTPHGFLYLIKDNWRCFKNFEQELE